MYSKRLLTKDYDRTDSQDTESLLTSEESYEKPLPSLPSIPSRRNSRLKTYLHIAAVVFYGVVTAVLYAWSVKLNGQTCACEDTAVYSPAREAVQYERHTIVHKITDDDSKYKGPPRPELDEAWDDLLQYNSIRVQQEDLDEANTTSVPLNDAEGGFLASLDVFHTLHCVNKIRQSYYSEYYHDPNPLADQREHFDHCIDLLRQVIMCHGDVALHTYEWVDEYPAPWPSTRTEHQCRNWDRIVDWAREHRVESLMGPILQHPVLGISYQGDEPGIEITPTTETAR